MRNQIIRAELPQEYACNSGIRRAWQLVDVEVYPAMRDSLNVEGTTIGLREKALRHKRVVVRPDVRKNEIKLVETIRLLIQTTANLPIESPERSSVVRKRTLLGWVEKVGLKRWHAHEKFLKSEVLAVLQV